MAKSERKKLHANLVDVIDEVVQEKVDEKFDQAEDEIVGKVIDKLEKQQRQGDSEDMRNSKDGEDELFNPLAGP